MTRFSNDFKFDGSPLDIEVVEQHFSLAFGLELSQIVVRIFPGYFNTIDIEAQFGGTGGIQNLPAEEVGTHVSQLIRMLLGNDALEKWIDNIQISLKAPVKDQADLLFKPIKKLPQMVKGMISDRWQSLPSQPLYVEQEKFEFSALVMPDEDEDESPTEADGKQSVGTVFQIEAPEADDYPAQSDMVVASSPFGYLWLAMRSDVPFYSCRFSQCNETFCYLKFDGREEFAGTYDGDRATIEEAIDDILIPNKWGCVVSGGTGRYYSYIDLGLTDVCRAIETLRQIVQSLGVSKRCWLQYFDADQANAWEGMYVDSPPPPLAE